MAQPKTEPPVLVPVESLASLQSRRPLAVSSFGRTDRGRVRPSNEDHFAVVELARHLHVHQTSVPQAKAQYSSHRGHIFLVADGMGGRQAGEVASALSVVSIDGFLLNTLKRFFNLNVPEEQNVLKEFQDALRQADARIFEETWPRRIAPSVISTRPLPAVVALCFSSPTIPKLPITLEWPFCNKGRPR